MTDWLISYCIPIITLHVYIGTEILATLTWECPESYLLMALTVKIAVFLDVMPGSQQICSNNFSCSDVVVGFSKIWVCIWKTTWHHILADKNLQGHTGHNSVDHIFDYTGVCSWIKSRYSRSQGSTSSPSPPPPTQHPQKCLFGSPQRAFWSN